MKRTPLYDLHLEAGARMVEFAGYEMPVRYSGVVEEHHAVRRAAGLFDVSHMGEIAIRGGQALEFLQRMTPNDVAALKPGRAHYSALLSERGTFLDDLLVYCRSERDYLLVVNAASAGADLDWLEEHARGLDLAIEDCSEATALLALQGPKALAILKPLTDVDLEAIGYYRFQEGSVLSTRATLSRTGYTGEDGFELYLDADAAPEVWSGLLAAGADHGLLAAGLGARDTLRLEAGMLLAGQDIDGEVTPLEAGLDWMVKLDRGDFVGRDSLLEAHRQGVGQRLIGFELTDRGIARPGCQLSSVYPAGDDGAGGREAVQGGDGFRGTVTSGTWSPTLERAIGIARVRPAGDRAQRSPSAEAGRGASLSPPVAGRPIAVEVRARSLSGRVAELPFYRRPRKTTPKKRRRARRQGEAGTRGTG